MSIPYELREKIEKLNSNLKESYNQKVLPSGDANAAEADLLWSSSRFWAQIIHSCAQSKYDSSLDNLLEFKGEYEAKNNVSFNTDNLFTKFWLRNVLGFVSVMRF